jgi:hypothetical protein
LVEAVDLRLVRLGPVGGLLNATQGVLWQAGRLLLNLFAGQHLLDKIDRVFPVASLHPGLASNAQASALLAF